MEIRRSEVNFVEVPCRYMDAVNQTISKGLKYYAAIKTENSGVFEVNKTGRICAVKDLIDDRPSPFPPLEAEPSSDTPTDRARDAALREVNR